MSRHIAFAVPGALETLTGGYIYDRRVMGALRDQSWTVDHIALPQGFPDPTQAQMTEALQQLHAVPTDCPVIIDGLAFGALDPERVAQIKAPIVALIHHPLAKETGLNAAGRDHFFETERQNLTQAAHILVPSPHTAQILTSEYDVPGDKITVATPGIDQPKTQPQPQTPPLILAVGIQLPRKGHDTLLHALSQITDLDWQAVIAGTELDPAYTQKLRSLRADLGLEPRVRLAGQVPPEALAELYLQAGLFALATRYEGYGIVFDEALVHGLPIVSCDTGAVADTVPSEAGTLVPPDAPKAFAGALRHLLTDPNALQNCAKASATAGAARPGWDATAQTIARVLDKTTRTPARKTALSRSFDVYYRDANRTTRMDRLNTQFVQPGGLTFDIGAHIGDRAGSFLRLGASVIMIEPQPRVFRALRLLYGQNPQATLRCEAVGAHQGQLRLFVNSDNPTISTASPDLITAAQDAPLWQGQSWDREITVPVTTLDQLIADHGLPDFVKVDVEGFELDVLKGLTSPLPALSFEFTTIQRDVALSCLTRLGELGLYEFNISFGEEHALHHPDWLTSEALRRELIALPEAANSGDIFARLKG